RLDGLRRRRGSRPGDPLQEAPVKRFLSTLLVIALLGALAGTRIARAAEDHPISADPAAPTGLQQSLATADSIAYAARVMTGNKVGLTLTNYGFIGSNFSSASPSFEYPLGSNHMHMVRGGPWIGAISADENGAFVGVSIAAQDGAAGYASAGS